MRLSVLCAILTSGCASAGGSWRGPAGSTGVNVLYATDRQLRRADAESCGTGSSQMPIRFGSDRSAGLLSYGQFSIRLPVPRDLGDIPDFIERHVCPPHMDPVYLAGPVPKDVKR